MKKIHLFVFGRVQGVFYRHFAIQKAYQLGLSGWIRNRFDGRVEATVVGSGKKLDQMLDWFRQGSPLAKVEKVIIISQKKIKEDPFRGKFEKRETV